LLYDMLSESIQLLKIECLRKARNVILREAR
jgi:hypothetical protein